MSGGTILAAASNRTIPRLCTSSVSVPDPRLGPEAIPEYVRSLAVDSSENLRGHVLAVSLPFKVTRHLSRPGTSHTKVTNAKPAIIRNKNVGRFEVKVNKAVRMDETKTLLGNN